VIFQLNMEVDKYTNFVVDMGTANQTHFTSPEMTVVDNGYLVSISK